jgi:hypothetical protein
MNHAYTVETLEVLTIRAIGPATSDGRLALSELARIASALQTTLERIGFSILMGRPHRMGRLPRQVAESVRLDLTGFREGSAILEVERSAGTNSTDDLLSDAFRVLAKGIRELQADNTRLPSHFTPPVVNGLAMLCGGISEGNILGIEFTSGGSHWFTLDRDSRASLKAAQRISAQKEITVIGRLHMGDFDPMSLRCRIDTHSGSVSCDLDDDLKDTVLDYLDELVMATGIAELQADGVAVRVLHLTDLTKIEAARFQTLDDLAAERGLRPLTDLASLRGEPIDDFDEFLGNIRSAR